jgi:arginyl-tRNA synthetase
VVGLDQTLHFRQISKALEILDVEPAGRIEHVPFGLIRFGESKMSTRAGNIVMLQEVIDRLRDSVRDVMAESNPDLDADALNDLVRSATNNVALGALVFEDLGRRRIKDVDFDWDRALKLTGDTGPYLQYTYARLRSIERKAEERGVEPSEPDFAMLDGDEEDAVINLLGQAQEALDRAVEEREPSVLASYLLSLAAAVNHFYNTKRVLGEEPPVETARLALVRAVRLVMGGEPIITEDGTTGEKTEIVGDGGLLYLLGIPAPGRM